MNKLRLDVNVTFPRKYISCASVVSIRKIKFPLYFVCLLIGPAACVITLAGTICHVHCRWGMVVLAPHSSRKN